MLAVLAGYILDTLLHCGLGLSTLVLERNAADVVGSWVELAIYRK
jgi:hypothetical protein